jgi:6-phosphofructokinase 1
MTVSTASTDAAGLSCPNIRRMAILTGGGDCPGLNAVIRAVALDALTCNIEVMGIEDGYLGLIENRFRPIREADLVGILARGGTILGSNNKSNPSAFVVGYNPPPPRGDGKPILKDVTDKCYQHLRQQGVEAMVIIGGDGTLTSAATFHRMGIPVVGVPKTIDNDIVGTEITFGFQTLPHDGRQPSSGDGDRGDGAERGVDRAALGRGGGRGHHPAA